MRQLYDNWLVFQQEQLAVHGWMARSGWPGEWAEAWAAAVGRCQEMLTSPPSLTIGPFSFLSIFQSNIQRLCHWNPTPCSLVGPILLPLETPPLVFIVCALTPCLRLSKWSFLGETGTGLLSFLKVKIIFFLWIILCIYTALFQETKNITKKIDQTFTRRCLDWVGLGGTMANCCITDWKQKSALASTPETWNLKSKASLSVRFRFMIGWMSSFKLNRWRPGWFGLDSTKKNSTDIYCFLHLWPITS